MRIVSLLPSATEIIARLGLIDSLVGRSNECTYPPEVQHLPVVTAARIDPAELESVEIDRQVREAIRDGRSLYAVDAALIERLAPDVIVTQDLCTVFAVSSGELGSACPVGATVISLDPLDARGGRRIDRDIGVAARRPGAGQGSRRRDARDDRRCPRSDHCSAQRQGLPPVDCPMRPHETTSPP